MRIIKTFMNNIFEKKMKINYNMQKYINAYNIIIILKHMYFSHWTLSNSFHFFTKTFLFNFVFIVILYYFSKYFDQK